jgi:hypothetical protein
MATWTEYSKVVSLAYLSSYIITYDVDHSGSSEL